MPRIDSHQHFWQYHPVKDAWITDDMKVIQRDFYPEDLQPVLEANKIDGYVAVQASQSEEENIFLMNLAKENTFIKGIVGWVNLQADDVEERLQYYQQYHIIKGFRHIIQGEADEQFMLGISFKRGISLLHGYNFTYDILVKPNHLRYVPELVAAFPRQRFVIDHMAKPFIKAKEINAWQKDMEKIARFKNVYCKVSGFCTEADWINWAAVDIDPYLDVVFSAFGLDRIMFGSDWPVCLVAGGYGKTRTYLEGYTSEFSASDRKKFWGDNAALFYNLNNL